MLAFITVVHLFIALVLIIFVLLQDSKGGAAGVFGGGSGSNSLFGSTGGADFLTKMTRYTAIMFAVTCLGLAYLTSKPQKSLMDKYVPPPASQTAPSNPELPAAVATPPPADQSKSKDTAKRPLILRKFSPLLPIKLTKAINSIFWIPQDRRQNFDD
jgi:preprotein translocase subunit SecG